jgi:DeoR/GlpR family transcriptional regulator of sugar metabolism
MLPTQRRQAILAELSERSAVAADELAREFDVSVETIRRDLRDLQRRGLLDRVYGVTRPAGRSSEGSFAARSTRHGSCATAGGSPAARSATRWRAS